MTAVCLKAKSSVQAGSWPNIFTNFNTDAKSCAFIKQLTSTCISTILHLRKILSEDYFEEKSFEGLTLKLLKRRKGDHYVTKIQQWLEGAFEAIEKKYLKRLILDIQDAKSNMTLEVYTISFNYSKEKEAMNRPPLATLNKESGFTPSPSDTELNTIKLLQMCYAVTQTYSSLPSQVKLSMRLSYYENTPDDYQPRGYMAWEPVSPEFPMEARCIELGFTSTQHHSFKLINKSCLNNKFFEDLDQFKSSNNSLPIEDNDEGTAQVNQTKAKRELRFDNNPTETALPPPQSSKNRGEMFVVSEKLPSNPDQTQKQKTELLNSKARKNVNSAIRQEIKNQKVRCACLSSDKSDTMFSCLRCRFLVHAECYGVLHFDATRKIRFYCHICHQNEHFKCHDKVLVGLKNSSDQQKLSVLRRVLRYCTKAYKITLKKMEKIAGPSCPKNIVIVVLNKVIEIGVAKYQKQRKSYLIDKNELEKNLLHYFYKVHDSTEIQHQIFPYSLRSLENIKTNNLTVRKQLGLQGCLTSNSQNSQQSCDIFSS